MSQHPSHAQQHRQSGQSHPIEIQKALHGIDYPANKTRLLETARANHADGDVLGLIDRLPDREFDSPATVSKEIGRLQ